MARCCWPKTAPPASATAAPSLTRPRPSCGAEAVWRRPAFAVRGGSVPGDRCQEPSEDGMIPRYTRPQMAQIWTAEARFRIWFEIEAHAASAMAELGAIPQEAAKVIWEKGSKAVFDAQRI